jgi:hypothetical protein
MFPGRVPGLALVLLRLGVAGSLWQLTLEGGPAMSTLRLWGLATLSFLLLLGLATPVIGLITSVILLMRLLDSPLPAEALAVAIQAITALALALIGPGAYSLDARLFGRRILISS